jgi:hypothetical protein
LLTLTGAIIAFDAAHTSSHRSAVHPSYVYVVAPHHVFVAFPIPHAVAVVGVVVSQSAVHAYVRDAGTFATTGVTASASAQSARRAIARATRIARTADERRLARRFFARHFVWVRFKWFGSALSSSLGPL